MATELPRPADQAEGGQARCANCGIEVGAGAVSREERSYCCDGCAEGGPCTC